MPITENELMDFTRLIRDYQLSDIITVDGMHYAISCHHAAVPGCVAVTPTQYPQYVRTFLHKGFSQLYGKPYSQISSVTPWVLFTYILTPLTPSQKQMFSHTLTGTGGRKGLLTQWRAEKIGRSAILVPLSAQQEVQTFFNQWRVAHTAEVMLRGN